MIFMKNYIGLAIFVIVGILAVIFDGLILTGNIRSKEYRNIFLVFYFIAVLAFIFC